MLFCTKHREIWVSVHPFPSPCLFKLFGIAPPNSNVETLCPTQKDHKFHVETSRGDKSSRVHGMRSYRGRGCKNNQGDKQKKDRKQRNFNDRLAIKCFRCGKIGHTATKSLRRKPMKGENS